jgi:hypothetical protein
MSQATKNLWAGPTPTCELVTCRLVTYACKRGLVPWCLSPGEMEPLPATIQAMF